MMMARGRRAKVGGVAIGWIAKSSSRASYSVCAQAVVPPAGVILRGRRRPQDPQQMQRAQQRTHAPRAECPAKSPDPRRAAPPMCGRLRRVPRYLSCSCCPGRMGRMPGGCQGDARRMRGGCQEDIWPAAAEMPHPAAATAVLASRRAPSGERGGELLDDRCLFLERILGSRDRPCARAAGRRLS
jgi:hypothetical protein